MRNGDQDQLGHQALEVIRQEAEAIGRVADSIPATDLAEASRLILGCEGKLILVGSGKSGIAARKIASTFTSTGTLALPLHPVDALHGDLGAVRAEDVAILISSSGENPELNELVFHLKRRGLQLIAITGAGDSTLAHAADVSLIAKVEREAGPLGLAPTTSTVVALAVGDALAVVVMAEKNISIDDFALNHPGGAIGRRLTTSVADLMHSGSRNPTVVEDENLECAISILDKGGLGAVSVVDIDGALKGILTDGDVRRFVTSTTQSTVSVGVKEIMTLDPVTVEPDAPAIEAMQLMEHRDSQIAVLPVVDEEGKAVGLIRIHDIVRAGLK